jgi:tetratricopeptide (TPR) repeat protein
MCYLSILAGILMKSFFSAPGSPVRFIVSVAFVAAVLAAFLSGCSLVGQALLPGQRPGSEPVEQRGPLPGKAEAYYRFLRFSYLLDHDRQREALAELQQAVAADPESSELLVDLSTLYLRQGDRDAALAAVQRAVKLDPGSVDGHLLLASLYGSLNQTKDAVAEYKEVLKLDPDHQKALLNLASLYATDSQYEQAYELLQGYVLRHPDNLLVTYYLGRMALELKRYPDAERLYLSALSLRPNFEMALFDLGYVYEVTDRYPEAETTYRKILALDPDNEQARSRLGDLYLRQENYRGALEEFQKVLDGKEEGVEMRLKVALIHLELGEQDQAIEILENLAAARPKDGEIRYYLGSAYLEKQDFDRAQAELDLVPGDSSYALRAAIQRAAILEKKGDMEGAVKLIRQAIERHPREPEGYLSLGGFYQTAKRFPEAAAALREGLAVAPDNPRLHFRLGTVLDKMGKREECIREMEKVIALDPKDAVALNYLGYTLAEMGVRLDQAEDQVKRALKLKPDDPYITDSLGWVYYKMGRYEDALKFLVKAREHLPDDPVVAEHVGDAYRALGRWREAEVSYERALHLGAEDRDRLRTKLDEARKKTREGKGD